MKFRGSQTPSARTAESKKKYWVYLLGGLILLLMVASALNLGYDSGDGQDRYEYNGYSFGLTGQSWVTYLENGQSLRVLYGPRDLASFPVDSNIGPLQSTSKIYLSIDPPEDVPIALAEVQTLTFGPPLVPACTADIPECADVPVKTCEDATPSTGVIVFADSEEPSIAFADNCLTIQGRGLDLVLLVDQLILQLAGI